MTRSNTPVASALSPSWPCGRFAAGGCSNGVARDHRGHGLGLRLKAASSLWMRELHPAARWVGTANHEGNAAMLRINHVLGYQPAERWYNYEFPISATADPK